MAARAALRGGGWAAQAAGALFALNVADAALTHRFLAQGLATEANPWMRLTFDASPALFWLVKIALVGAFVLLLVSQRRRPLTPLALLVGICAYASVVAYHLLLMGSGFLAQGGGLP